jgi:hypothetical protein
MITKRGLCWQSAESTNRKEECIEGREDQSTIYMCVYYYHIHYDIYMYIYMKPTKFCLKSGL